MAGSITATAADIGGSVTKYTIVWTSDASGNVSGNTAAVKRGHLMQAKFVPGSGGSQPTDLYDVTVLDSDSIDLLIGLGVDRSATAASMTAKPDGSGAPAAGPLCWFEGGSVTPTVANAGNAKSGTLILYVGP